MTRAASNIFTDYCCGHGCSEMSQPWLQRGASAIALKHFIYYYYYYYYYTTLPDSRKQCFVQSLTTLSM